jgi:hypothetical protein
VVPATLAVALALAVATLVLPGTRAPSLPLQTSAPETSASRQLPLWFEPNLGQLPDGAGFGARALGHSILLGPVGATLTYGPSAAETLTLELMGADERAEASALERQPGTVNHLKGARSQWVTGVPAFGRVVYEDVYPGIDVHYSGVGGQLRYDFVVAPGADPSTIVLRFGGARGLRRAPNGDLVVDTPVGELRHSAPVVYQHIDGEKVFVPAAFVLQGTDTVRFALGDYERAFPLVIDPTLSYGTFIGGSGFDITFGIAVGPDGSAYVAGQTGSANFPTKGEVACPTPTPAPTPPPAPTSSFQCDQKDNDAFVLRLSPDGSQLVYATYLGGDRFDQAWDVAVDEQGNAYVIGATESADDPGTVAIEKGFPTTANAFDQTCGSDGFCDAAVPAPGSCTVQAGCPTVPLTDAFVAKLSPDGSDLLYSTYLGGSDQDQEVQTTALPSEMSIAVRGAVAYAVGSTASPDFPTTAGAFQRRCGSNPDPVCDDGNRDVFLSVIDTAARGASSLRYSTYLGGRGWDDAHGVAVDGAGNAYVAGTTFGFDRHGSLDNDFPVKNAFQPSYGGGEGDAFVAKIDPRRRGGRSLRYSSYLGGGGRDLGWSVAVKFPRDRDRDDLGTAFVTGFTDSGDDPATSARDGIKPYFPTTKGAFDRSYNGEHTQPDGSNLFMNGDAYVTKVAPSGSRLVYSTYLGGGDHDVGAGIAVDQRGRAYVVGYTTCDNQDPTGPPCVGTFPVKDALFPNMDGRFIAPQQMNIPTDAFLAKLNSSGSDLVYSTYIPGVQFDRAFAVAVRDRDANGSPITPEAYVAGRTGSSDLPVTQGAFQTTRPGGPRDGFIFKIQG